MVADAAEVSVSPVPGSPSKDEGTVAEENTDFLKIETLRAFVGQLATTILDIQDKSAFDGVLEDSETDSKLEKFVSDTKIPVLFVQKLWKEEETNLEAEDIDDGGDGDDRNSKKIRIEETFRVTFEVEYTPGERSMSIAFIKLHPDIPLEQDRSVGSQLQFISLSDGTPLETLHGYVHNSFVPLFQSFLEKKSGTTSVRNTSSSIDGVARGLRVIKQKIAELDLVLYNAKQDVQIEPVRLQVHPEILAVAHKCTSEGRTVKVEDFGERAKSPEFLNAIQAGVNVWIKDIQKVTKLERIEKMPETSSANQEVSFWQELEVELHNISKQLKSPETGCEVTLSILKQAKRFIATAAFDTDTIGLKKATEKVHNYRNLMKQFPVTSLVTAVEPDSIKGAIVGMFLHMKKTKNVHYPIPRYLQLLEAYSKDVGEKLSELLLGKRVMSMPYEDFYTFMSQVSDVIANWEDQFEQFRDFTLRDIGKRRGQDKVLLRINNNVLKKLEERVNTLTTFRKHHNEFLTVVMRVLPQSLPGEFNPLNEIKLAYENVVTVNVWDMSVSTEEWSTAMRSYESKIGRVEAHITAKVRDLLAQAKNANEMFHVFSKFNALFFRPRIRGAIQEYQAQLISRTKDDVKTLMDKFKQQYTHSEASFMSNLRDLPPASGSIIWTRQIQRQLQAYMKRVEDVLGKQWELDPEGHKLKTEGDRFLAKLNIDSIFDKWVQNVESRNLEISGRILAINQKGKGSVLQVAVSFDNNITTLFKEVRNLQWLGFRLPFKITLLASSAKQIYPFAITVRESLRTYEQTNRLVVKEINPLVASYKLEVQNALAEGFSLRWESLSKLDPFVKRLANAVSTYKEKADDLLVKYDLITQQLIHLQKCHYQQKAYEDVLENIQKVIDDLNLASYSNLESWVKSLDERIEVILKERLVVAIKVWVNELMEKFDEKIIDDKRGRHFNFRRKLDQEDDEKNEAEKLMESIGRPKLKVFVHEILIRNQVMFLYPPLEAARQSLVEQFHDWLGVVCLLKRIESSRFDANIGHNLPGRRGIAGGSISSNQSLRTFNDILGSLEGMVVSSAYSSIEMRIQEISEYVEIWLQYQALWDLEPAHVFRRLGDNLEQWQTLLHQIKSSRVTFDTSDSEKRFGPIVIDYNQVQAGVNNKYDYWHKDVLHNFGAKLGETMRDLYDTLSSYRLDLEKLSLEQVTTEEVVGFLLKLQDIKRKMSIWDSALKSFQEGSDLLSRQRFLFPVDWLEVDMVEGEWMAFNEIYSKKTAEVNAAIPQLQKKIIAEGKLVSDRIQTFVDDWSRSKPTDGSLLYSDALASLNIFSGRYSRLKDEYDKVTKAKVSLDIEIGKDENERIDPISEEIQDLNNVWAELGETWKEVEKLKETPWPTVIPRKIRKSLEDIIDKLSQLPTRIRQYSAFEHIKSTLSSYLKNNLIITDLRSEALRERHWQVLKKRLNKQWILNELTLGHLWDCEMERNSQIFREVITQAQGELALEEFLKEVREYWSTLELDLVNYQNKCWLIKGWDDMFAKVADHLTSVNSMKLSPFFKVFAEEASGWEDKLNRIQALFDVWIEVQRRWVYLEGIFTGSADIAQLLPQESSRFRSMNAEFINLMKKVKTNALLLEVLSIEGIQKALDRLSDLLGKIQKALGEYLERQRAAFPRFYFVGDEDLLEIIGNSKDLLKIQKHLKKMFAGLHSLVLNESADSILGMSSSEGEEIPFVNPIKVAGAKINEWLSSVVDEMQLALAASLSKSLETLRSLSQDQNDKYLDWIDVTPAQIVVLCTQIQWSEVSEKAMLEGSIEDVLESTIHTLDLLADSVLLNLPAIRRRKYEHLIAELVHQRDVIRDLMKQNVNSPKDFEWLYHLRFYFDENAEKPIESVVCHMANGKFFYGWEYLGIAERLVQTPLTDRCYLTLTQALESRMGGNPFGPAGTGKTETVKSLGGQLGRFVVVFCCDEAFDLQAMSRIFIGLCLCGAWGCFDEFNRLEERILSAVSQQIQTIQICIRNGTYDVEMVGRQIKVNPDLGVFITMNPGYAGRSNLPDNLKQLFRGIAMIKPDRELIAQVMLYSQGFKTAEILAGKIVPLFKLCDEQLSEQSHYDFGLRALKAVLVSAGNIKRSIADSDVVADDKKETVQESEKREQEVLIRSVTETMIPKLVSDDIVLLKSLVQDVFPGADLKPIEMKALRGHIDDICLEKYLVPDPDWIEKILQLGQILSLQHGVMMVGPSGSGKSCAWKVLLEALSRLESIKGENYIIDPKAITKDQLFGTLDSTTREWTDGMFTHILRKIIDNVRGESSKRHWIVFDGDVDPEWVENLNSLLDDNRILTLPNGERLALPRNVRIMFEVQDLKYATLATVSRCGMVFFSEETLTNQMIFQNYLSTLINVPFDEAEQNTLLRIREGAKESIPTGLVIQRECAEIIKPFFGRSEIVEKSLEEASTKFHVMDFTRLRVLTAFFSLLNKGIADIIEYNTMHSDFPLEQAAQETFIKNKLVFGLMWAFGGSMNLRVREEFSTFIHKLVSKSPVPPVGNVPLLDYTVEISDGGWSMYTAKVPLVDIEPHKVGSPDIVIPTVDTVRHAEVLHAYLAEHRPLLLCGPPGSGKTMSLNSTLCNFPDFEVVNLNFSSATSPELLLKTFEHHCEFKRTPNGGTVMRPTQMGIWLVIFCDEINLPQADRYGTARVISFLRQLTEQNGYWRTEDHTWISLERIQFVGACNPPTDPGRVPITHRFLRYAPLLLVDFPSYSSLIQIYGTFNRALMKLAPSLRNQGDALTSAMVDVYTESQCKFTPDMHAHYIYSPRELSRWVRAMHEALKASESMTLDELVRLWAHEALRLFCDRLVEESERKWTNKVLDEVAYKHFPDIKSDTLARPILFSNWLTKEYISVKMPELRDYVKARLRVFYEEELDVPLVLFNEVLEHILRIDRVFRQPQGHVLLIGVSGGGKTVLSRFVAWMNGLSIFTIKVNNKYKASDFDEDLRHVMKRSGCQDEKVCFIFDESNVLESNFLERMNTLLAGGEVPGLFEGEEWTSLMHQCKTAVANAGLVIDGEDELYKWFTGCVRRNLHVVFTMNPASPEFHNRAATSPALFNRCVLDWFGEWSSMALYQVGMEFTNTVDLEDPTYQPPAFLPDNIVELPSPPSHRDSIVGCLVFVHETIGEANAKLSRLQGRFNYVTPRHYLDFIKHFVSMTHEKREELEEEQLHLNIGLKKLLDTEQQVKDLQISLRSKKEELAQKEEAANQKLKQMVTDQQEAEKQKVESLKLQKKLDVQNADIDVRKKKAYADLEKAEPALISAQKAVSGIKKKHLDEVKSLRTPPHVIQLTLECVMYLLHGKKVEWAAIRRYLSDTSLIPSIVNFNTRKITEKMRVFMRKNYMSDPKFTFETVNHASQACGPLVKWGIAQVDYSEIMDRVKPLREEVEQLEEAANVLKKKQEKLVKKISSLEENIEGYKQEYAQLISAVQEIKAEMTRVQNKVERSIALLDNLSEERERWVSQKETFQVHMSTVVGDVLLSAAFLAYSGFFDQHFRQDLMHKWQIALEQLSIKYKPELSVVEFLAKPEERLKWQANSLPADDLCTENAIMLKRFNRYPLVIDPSGQAMEFLINENQDKKLAKTSFLDSSFMKNLESSLRFGCPLLVQDVENMDPVLNPVLNKEIRKKGGRVLIRLGDNDIDFSPSFVIFMFTRDPTVHFTPDLCSRVTFVNFTVTPNSLQSQCLHKILKSEQPEVYQKQQDLVKLQGEFRVKLRDLEKSLLNALSKAEGNILDDDKVIATLESIKKEANEVGSKMQETEVVMTEIELVSNTYKGMAMASSRIYFALEQLSQVHFLYQFSLRFFLDVFNDLFEVKAKEIESEESTERMNILLKILFETIFRKVCRTLLNEDHVTFAGRLAQIYLKGTPEEIEDVEYDFFLKGGDTLVEPKNFADSVKNVLTVPQQRFLFELSQTCPTFKTVPKHMADNIDEWTSFLNSPTAEFSVPESWISDSLKVRKKDLNSRCEGIHRSFWSLILIKAFRRDRVVFAAANFVSAVFGKSFLAQSEFDFDEVVQNESSCGAPLLLCSAPGFDASTKVDDLASFLKKSYKAFAIGSPEGFELAEKAINNAAKGGSWVLLKNIHLAPQWLVQLEKKLHSLTPHPDFRLFMTSEIHPKLPANLLRLANVFSFEAPPGIKANLQHTFSTLGANRMNQQPAERSRLYFLLAWFHAVVQNRLRYAPLGWTKTFEFNDTDYRGALDTIDYWLSTKAKDKSNIAPDLIPWVALRTILVQAIYGGRIDNEFDMRLLVSLVDQLFTPDSFNSNFMLVNGSGEDKVQVPEGASRDQFLTWIEELSGNETPVWLGLPDNAELLLLTNQGKRVIQKLQVMQSMDDGESAAAEEASMNTSSPDDSEQEVRPLWIRQLQDTCEKWLALLPKPLAVPKVTAEKVKDPLFRSLAREVKNGSAALEVVRQNLKDLIQTCLGELKQTNELRQLMNDLSKGVIPKQWRWYHVPDTVSLNVWILDFVLRIDQFKVIGESSNLALVEIWLGGLFNPEAYITATRQAAAQAKQLPLEQLVLTARFDGSKTEGQEIKIRGLSIDGAEIVGNKVNLTSETFIHLPQVVFEWVHGEKIDPAAEKKKIGLAMYLNETREDVLMQISVDTAIDVPASFWYQRSIALISWRPNN